MRGRLAGAVGVCREPLTTHDKVVLFMFFFRALAHGKQFFYKFVKFIKIII
jgi:hypothetical protein